MAIITKELALKIAKKLQAEVKVRKGSPHDMATIYHEGRLIALFGIRRGSRKDLGHDHVPRNIYLSPHNARLLGQCPLSREEWLQQLVDRGLI